MKLTAQEKALVDREIDGQNQELLRKLQFQRDMPAQVVHEPLAFDVLPDKGANGQNFEPMLSVAALEQDKGHLQEQLDLERGARCAAERKTQLVEVERDCSNRRADAAEARETKMREELSSRPTQGNIRTNN